MKRTTKIWLLVAAGLVLLGAILFVGVMAEKHWDFAALWKTEYQTDTESIGEDFRSITVRTAQADVALLPSEDGTCSVAFYEREPTEHKVSVENGTLVIEMLDQRSWYERFSLDFGSPSVTVYLPEGDYEALTVVSDTADVQIPAAFSFAAIDVQTYTGDVVCQASAAEKIGVHTDAGDIRLQNLSAGALELSVTTGRVELSALDCAGDIRLHVSTGKAVLLDVTCQNFTTDGSTGDLELADLLASGTIRIERSTGDVGFTRCDAAELTVRTDTGHVIGSLRSEKVFIAQSDTGRIDVPKTTSGGKCEITTDTGSIQIRIG